MRAVSTFPVTLSGSFATTGKLGLPSLLNRVTFAHCDFGLASVASGRGAKAQVHPKHDTSTVSLSLVHVHVGRPITAASGMSNHVKLSKKT